MRRSPLSPALVPILACLILFLSSCSQRIIRSDLSHQDLMFPLGRYFHHVKLAIQTTPGTPLKEFSFNGVFQIRAESITIVALSPFGTTIMRINEDRKTGKIDIHIYYPPLEKFETPIREYYGVFRALLISAKDPHPATMKIALANATAELHVDQFDKNQIPEKIHVDHPKFALQIEVTGYEL